MKLVLCCLFLCLTSLYSVTLDDLISFREGAFIDNKKFHKTSYRFRLEEKISKTSGIFTVYIDIEYKGGSRVIRSGNSRGRWGSSEQSSRGFSRRVSTVGIRDRRATQRLREESWRDNNLGRVPDNGIRRSEKIYIEDIDLSDEVVGELVDFKNKTLYRSGIFSRPRSVSSGRGRGGFRDCRGNRPYSC